MKKTIHRELSKQEIIQIIGDHFISNKEMPVKVNFHVSIKTTGFGAAEAEHTEIDGCTVIIET